MEGEYNEIFVNVNTAYSMDYLRYANDLQFRCKASVTGLCAVHSQNFGTPFGEDSAHAEKLLADAIYLRMRALDERVCPSEEPIIIGEELTKKWVDKFRDHCHAKGGLLPDGAAGVQEVIFDGNQKILQRRCGIKGAVKRGRPRTKKKVEYSRN